MENLTVYLSGGMQSFGKEQFDKSNDWRRYFKSTLENYYGAYRVSVFNPNDKFNFKDEPRYASEDEVMRYDLYRLRKADLIIVNFNDPKSLGTMAEIAIGYDRGIPILGLNEDKTVLHSWQIGFCERIFENADDLSDYVEEFYLS